MNMDMASCTTLPYHLFTSVLVATFIPIYAQHPQIEMCKCNCMKIEEPRCRGQDMIGFKRTQEFTSPTSELQNINQCPSSPVPSLSNWTCCKLQGHVLCTIGAEFLVGGHCVKGNGNPRGINQDCYTVNCTCEFDEAKSQPKSLSTGASLGIGLGIGFLAMVVVMIALMIYCRKQGIKQGSKQTTVSSVHTGETKGENDLGEYAEISENLYQGEQGLTGATNPGYDTVNGIITNNDYTHLAQPDQTSHYQSLKKSSNDFGTPDYIDPEKYTEPPKLKATNGIETTDNKDNEKYTGTMKKKSGNDFESPAYRDPKKYKKPQMPSTPDEQDDDYVTQYDTPKPTDGENGKGLPSSPPEKRGNEDEPDADYVDVDDPSLSINKTNGSAVGSDYIDVDDPSLSKNKTISSAVGSEYVDVDDPSLKKGQAQNASTATSDYVDVDDPSLSTRMSSTRSDGDYVDM